MGAPAVPSPSPSSPQVLGFQVRFPDEREDTLAVSPCRSSAGYPGTLSVLEQTMKFLQGL